MCDVTVPLQCAIGGGGGGLMKGVKIGMGGVEARFLKEGRGGGGGYMACCLRKIWYYVGNRKRIRE